MGTPFYPPDECQTSRQRVFFTRDNYIIGPVSDSGSCFPSAGVKTAYNWSACPNGYSSAGKSAASTLCCPSGGHIICGYELTWSDGKRFSYEDRKTYLASHGHPICDTQGWNAECDNLVTHGLWQCKDNEPITFFKSCPKKPNTSEGPCKRQNTDNSGNSRCY